MPSASTKSYSVEYVHVDSVAKIPELLGLMLSINYNVDLNARREVAPDTVGENGETIPGTVTDHCNIRISKNGVNPVVLSIGSVLVWDNSWLYVFDVATFTSRYTVN